MGMIANVRHNRSAIDRTTAAFTRELALWIFAKLSENFTT